MTKDQTVSRGFFSQEFAEYVSVRPTYAPLYTFMPPTNQQPKLDLSEITNSSENLNIRSSGNSRDTSPVLSERLESVQETPLDCDLDLKTLEQDPQYLAKVTIPPFAKLSCNFNFSFNSCGS